MEHSANLKGKRAVVFGAGGSIGAAFAKEFAAQGAEVFLSGRTTSKVRAVAVDIDPKGKCAHAAEVDALDERAVNDYFESVVRDAGGIDVVFNAIGPLAAEYGGGKPAVGLTAAEFMIPLTTVVSKRPSSSRARRCCMSLRAHRIQPGLPPSSFRIRRRRLQGPR